jgi:hypothetical protein
VERVFGLPKVNALENTLTWALSICKAGSNWARGDPPPRNPRDADMTGAAAIASESSNVVGADQVENRVRTGGYSVGRCDIVATRNRQHRGGRFRSC